MSATERLVAISCLISLAAASLTSNKGLVSLNQVIAQPPFNACVDDSDCSAQGPGYACFQYICYPWEDDSAVSQDDQIATCKSNDDCSGGLSCFRHHDRRNIHKGLCLEESVDCKEGGRSDCSKPECCNGQYCCDTPYFTQLKKLPCFSDEGCKDMGYGNFCCPNKANSSMADTCCNEDPYPTTTTTTTTTTTPVPITPKAASKTSGAEGLSSLFLYVFLLPLAFWRQ